MKPTSTGRWTNSETIGANGVMEEPHGGTIIENVINFGTACDLCRRTGNAFL